MLTTAKSIQLLDASGMNISPITDITSLYYEVANPNDNRIVSRKYVYDGFPVAVNINPTSNASIGIKVNTGSRHPDAGPLYINGNYYRVIDKHTNSDILVSNITTEIIPGTTYRLVKISNYNLSKILTYYTPLDLMDVSVNKINNDINNLNSNINNLNNKINNIITSLNATNVTLSVLQRMASQNNLTPNKFYLITDYYLYNDIGCMFIPNSNNFRGSNIYNKRDLLVKANYTNKLDGKIYDMYDSSNGNSLNIYGTYEIINDGNNIKLKITYLKDQYGNEAPYDFYNLRYNGGSGNTYYWTFTINNNNALPNNGDTIYNNIIKTNPYKDNKFPIFNVNNSNIKISNNYIGFNTNVNINSSSTLLFINNIIHNSNNINFLTTTTNNLDIENMLINDNNNIEVDPGSGNIEYNNIIIINNNNILFWNRSINNLTINSSNNITLERNANNVTILNNCNGKLYLSNNIIIDNFTMDTAFNTSQNCVYMFNLNIYAKSFNTVK